MVVRDVALADPSVRSLLAIMELMQSRGKYFATRKELSVATGRHKDTVWRTLREMVGLGWVATSGQRDLVTGRVISSLYRLTDKAPTGDLFASSR